MLAITLYLTLKSLHILAAIVWVGGAVTTQAFAIRTMHANDPERMAAFTKDVEFIGQRLFTSASLVLLLLGIWMAISWAATLTLLPVMLALLRPQFIQRRIALRV